MASLSNQHGDASEDLEVLLEELASDNLENEEIANKALVGYIRSGKIFNFKAIKEIISKAWVSMSRVHIL